MLVNRIGFIVVTFLLMLILSVSTKNIIISGIITFVTVIIGYIIIANVRNKKRVNLLEENCDPQAFLEATEKQRDMIGKKDKYSTYLNIDKAAGLINMGEFQNAKELLMSIDKTQLSVRNGTLLAYTINLLCCLYELGEISHAEEIFETQVPLLPPVNARMTLSMKLLVAERFLFLNRYEESKEKFQELLNEKMTKRMRISVLYDLAKIDESTGDIDSAQKKYREVAELGNKLWIAEEAKKNLK
ncbi:tripartite tricarboxylate transporter TctB family protein [Clostridium sp. MSJ-11]|uniref:Tripartite tricarboxylate transporter TctB family protein n=1 Tax=Clostridium mobile TaxID=2841512 RepID=A0ABS6EIE4_9CLOT|nr:tripartite tricarboxylate transporter TctB family protein [Clostridium mobile]MBU5484164.1 tripartite tricarboxylate transporter TctB family protein [Clostridium mobile]